ncbi:hypothetical protein GQ457_17G010470 [Hibiscus cannabinus]
MVLRKIAAIRPPHPSQGNDVIGWRWEKSRKFSLKSAYKSIDNVSIVDNNVDWKFIWKLNIPQRIWVFIWLALRNGLIMNAERACRHLTDSSRCQFAQHVPEAFWPGLVQDELVRSRVLWCLPENGWVKINCDGAVSSKGGAAAGGVIRDDQGLWRYCMIVFFSHEHLVFDSLKWRPIA